MANNKARKSPYRRNVAKGGRGWTTVPSLGRLI